MKPRVAQGDETTREANQVDAPSSHARSEPRTRVKICGVTSVADADAAAAAGADYLGLIFAPSSVRSVTLDDARQIVAAVARRCQTVAVFQDAPLEWMQTVVAAIGCDLIQLHGDEPLEVAAALPCPVIRAVTVTPETRPADVLPWTRLENVAHLLFDRPKRRPVLDWELCLQPLWEAAQTTAAGRQAFIAGGLSAENVAAVVQRWQPYGVDVASGVESAPGKKDARRMQAFCRSVRSPER
ncbi:MAG: phosphoribosylanthranilate isomerase [Chloracidobacterium sp.]